MWNALKLLGAQGVGSVGLKKTAGLSSVVMDAIGSPPKRSSFIGWQIVSSWSKGHFACLMIRDWCLLWVASSMFFVSGFLLNIRDDSTRLSEFSLTLAI